MSISAEVIRIRNHNDDHELGGLDLPVTVTLSTHPQHAATAAEMVEAGLGEFARINAFNIRVLSAGIIQFATFDIVTPGHRFIWNYPVGIERRIIQARIKIDNVIERNMLVARSERNAFQCKEGDSESPPPIFDRKGAVVHIGDWCQFLFPDTGRRGIGWITNLGSHPVRPIGVRPLNERLIGGLGARTTEIEVMPDFRI